MGSVNYLNNRGKEGTFTNSLCLEKLVPSKRVARGKPGSKGHVLTTTQMAELLPGTSSLSATDGTITYAAESVGLKFGKWAKQRSCSVKRGNGSRILPGKGVLRMNYVEKRSYERSHNKNKGSEE